MNTLLLPVCSDHKKILVEILGRITRDWLKRKLRNSIEDGDQKVKVLGWGNWKFAVLETKRS